MGNLREKTKGRGETNEPVWWSLFVLGGTAALLLPVAIVLTGIAPILGWITQERLAGIVASPWVRILLFLVIALPQFHAAHRIRLVFRDTGLRAWDRSWLSGIFYGAAALGTVLAAVFLLRL